MYGSEDCEFKLDEWRRKFIIFFYKVWDFLFWFFELLCERFFGVEKEEMVLGILKDGGLNINRILLIFDEIMVFLMDVSLVYVFEYSGCILGVWYEF